MSNEAYEERDGGVFLGGVALCACGLVLFVEGQFEGGLFLFVFGLGLMAYESEKLRSDLFHVLLEFLRKLLGLD
jgi:hypothetical protein